jgi:hypothetical protein
MTHSISHYSCILDFLWSGWVDWGNNTYALYHIFRVSTPSRHDKNYWISFAVKSAFN